MKPTPLNLADVSCNLCGYHDATVLFPATDKQIEKADTFSCTSPGHGEYYRMVRCKRSGLRFSSPRPTGEAFQAEYQQVEDPMYEQELDGRFITFRRNLKHVETFCKSRKMLDIGAGMGVFLHLAKLNGWHVNGLEPSSWSTQKSITTLWSEIKCRRICFSA